MSEVEKKEETEVIPPVIEETKVAEIIIPDTVVKEIAKEGVDVDDKIKSALRKGSEITKNQLYPEINRQKAKIKELSDQLASKKNEETDASKTKAELVKIESEKTELAKNLKIVEDALVDTSTKLESLTEDYTTTKMESYKNKKIAETRGKLVEGMVAGKTEEEIDASIESAKKEYERIETSMKKEFKIPEKKEETPEEKEALKPTTVTRIEANRESVTDWNQKRKAVLGKVYAEARAKLGING